MSVRRGAVWCRHGDGGVAVVWRRSRYSELHATGAGQVAVPRTDSEFIDHHDERRAATTSVIKTTSSGSHVTVRAFATQTCRRRRLMPWLHAPISSSDALSDVAEPSEVQKPRPRKSDGMCIDAHSFRFPRTSFLPVSQKTPSLSEPWTRKSDVSSDPIFSSGKLRQHLGQGNRWV